MKGYKGFNKDMTCRGKQYSENTVYEENGAIVCKCGMHFCENPFDVLDHYDLVNGDGSFNEFAEVEALEDAKTDDNKKYCTTKLKVGAKLGITGFINACIDFVLEKTKVDDADITKRIKKINLLSDNGGDSAKIGSSGYSAKIGSSGDSAQIGSSGYYAKITSTGENSVICCAGNKSVVSANVGSWITLSEWEYSKEKERYVPKCVKTEYVDGERIKGNVKYILKEGEFKEYVEV